MHQRHRPPLLSVSQRVASPSSLSATLRGAAVVIVGGTFLLVAICLCTINRFVVEVGAVDAWNDSQANQFSAHVGALVPALNTVAEITSRARRYDAKQGQGRLAMQRSIGPNQRNDLHKWLSYEKGSACEQYQIRKPSFAVRKRLSQKIAT